MKLKIILVKGCDILNFNIQESGKLAINNKLKENNKIDKSFRIYIRRISRWIGPIFDVALDEPTEKDLIFEADGYKIFIRKELAEKINNIEIFYEEGISKTGFRVLTDIMWQYNYQFEDWAK